MVATSKSHAIFQTAYASANGIFYAILGDDMEREGAKHDNKYVLYPPTLKTLCGQSIWVSKL